MVRPSIVTCPVEPCRPALKDGPSSRIVTRYAPCSTGRSIALTRAGVTSLPETPSQGQVYWPSCIKAGTTRRMRLTGMAKPMPRLLSEVPPVSIWALTPITSPERLSSGPPELPGLMAASVWMAWGMVKAVRVGRARPMALMMPRVRVPSSPNGLPIATTVCPTDRVSMYPRVRGVMSCGRSACTTARSL